MWARMYRPQTTPTWSPEPFYNAILGTYQLIFAILKRFCGIDCTTLYKTEVLKDSICRFWLALFGHLCSLTGWMSCSKHWCFQSRRHFELNAPDFIKMSSAVHIAWQNSICTIFGQLCPLEAADLFQTLGVESGRHIELNATDLIKIGWAVQISWKILPSRIFWSFLSHRLKFLFQAYNSQARFSKLQVCFFKHQNWLISHRDMPLLILPGFAPLGVNFCEFEPLHAISTWISVNLSLLSRKLRCLRYDWCFFVDSFLRYAGKYVLNGLKQWGF